MNTPDITPAQIAAYVVALVGAVAAIFGFDLSDGQKAAILALVPLVLGAIHMLSDAHVRNGRSRALAPAPAAPTVNVAAPESVIVSAHDDAPRQPEQFPYDTSEARLHAADQAAAGWPRHDADGQAYGDTPPEPEGPELPAEPETADGV